jgi:hypothetical protein
MILMVEANGEGGGSLAQIGGPAVPDWGADEAGQGGKAFAKLLRDLEMGEAPVVTYWK